MPLLSVVIPSHKRAHLVARAIASAIDCCGHLDVELVVVPNGPDDGWKMVAKQYADDIRVSWHPLPTGNASAARNHGVRHSAGKYVRFLDDDDYMLPFAGEQLSIADRLGLDVLSGPLQRHLADGRPLDLISIPQTQDFLTAAISSTAVSLTQGTIFRKTFIEKTLWREDVVLYDDYLWMLDVALSGEATWIQTSQPVCAYVQHDGARLSRALRSRHNSQILVDALLNTHQLLREQERLSDERRGALAAALLTHAHSAFPVSPLFLDSVIRQATEIDLNAKPSQPIFHTYPILAKYLREMEWATLPIRYLTRSYRRARWSLAKLFANN